MHLLLRTTLLLRLRDVMRVDAGERHFEYSRVVHGLVAPRSLALSLGTRSALRTSVGKKLLAHGEAEITERGFRTFRLRVIKSTALAVSFYLLQGWTVEREFLHERLPVTMLEMTKPAAP